MFVIWNATPRDRAGSLIFFYERREDIFHEQAPKEIKFSNPTM
jgi:hypothetical protein